MERTPGKFRILIVDDNIAGSKMLAMLLARFGKHDIEVVHDGLAAIDRAAAFRPDLVLLDIGMPKMNGYEVAKRAPANSGAQTNHVSRRSRTTVPEEDRKRSRDAGFKHEHLVETSIRPKSCSESSAA